MENKQPKEIWIDGMGFTSTEPYSNLIKAKAPCMRQTKYLSSTHVEELLAEKDREIRYLVKLVAERNAELAEKEREIEQLKNARLSENISISTQFIASEDAEMHTITYYDFVNKGHVQHECKASVKAGHTYQVIQEGDKLRLEDITPIENLLKNN